MADPKDVGLDRTLRDAERASNPPARAATAAFAPVEEGERYRVEAQLGEGGMGTVTLCADRRINRRVAMKTLHDHGAEADPGDEARFFREARVQGQLEHPAIVPVYDLGRGSDGRAFFTMKRVRGVTLADVIDRIAAGDAEWTERYSPHRLLTAFASVCMAVDFAHQRGVLHRDLKPSNVMLGDFGEVYVLDWGVARVLADAEPTEVTDSGRAVTPVEGELGGTNSTVAGTISYMSPEQLRGEALSARSDVYALGATLFELLALEPLCAEPTLSRQLIAILGGLEARPSSRAPRHGVAPELDAICARALQLAPEHRYASARELYEAVDGYLAGQRDAALRAELAERHAVAAEGALPQLDEASLEQRRQALREVGRALALDPRNRRAFDAFVRILESPPREIPPEVEQQQIVEEQAARQRVRRVAMLSYGSFFLFAPLLLWAGILSWPWVLIFWLSQLGIVVAASFIGRRAERFDRAGQIMLWLSVLGFAASTSLFGPLVYTNVGLTVVVFGYTLMLQPERRWWPVIGALLVILLPFAAQLLGLMPPSYTFEAGTMVIHPLAVELRPWPTMAFLGGSAVNLIFAASLAASRARQSRFEAERRNLLHRWQLAQLGPDRSERQPI